MSHYTNGNGRSLSDLERQAETTRSELAQTVDELQSRVSPTAIKRDVRNYARETGQQFLGSLEDRARENPLAAVAVAAGLALPLWRMVSKIPAPILLVGAGLAMSRRGSSVSHSAYSGMPHASHDQGATLSEKVSGIAKSIGDKATDMIEDTQYNAEMVTSRVKDTVAEKVDAVREMASGAASTISETTADMSHQAMEQMGRARSSLMDSVERHPLLAGGIVLAIGGLVASALPVSRTESRIMGGASDEVRQRAKDIAKEGAEVLQTAANDAYEDVVAQTRSQGFTPDTARSAVKSAAEHAGTVIDKAAEVVEGQRSSSLGNRTTRKQKITNPESDNG